MKRAILSVAAACALLISSSYGSIYSAEAAWDDTHSIKKSDSALSNPEYSLVECEALLYETATPILDSGGVFTGMKRTPSRVEWDIPAGDTMRTDVTYSLEADELIIIQCTYSPRIATPDFGLLTPDGVFRFTTGRNGIMRTAIRVSETGTYSFAVRSNTDTAAEVLGYIYYPDIK